MDFLLACFSICVATVLFLLYCWLTSTSKNLPPGPKPLPIVGNLLHLGDKPHQSLANLAKLHGPILSLRLGQTTTIVISSPPLAKEILKVHDLNFCNRKIPEAVKALNHHDAGMAWLPVSNKWRMMRKMCNSNIFTTRKLDANLDMRQRKVHELLQEAERKCLSGEAMDIGEAAFNTAVNVLSSTVLSIDLAHSTLDSGSGGGLKNLVRFMSDSAGTPNLSDYYPLLRKLDLQGIKRRSVDIISKLLDLFDVIINERLETRKKTNGSVPTADALDTLINTIEDDSETLSRNDVKHLFIDLFVGGSDTTATTLEWAMSEILRSPASLFKAKAELNKIIGKGNIVRESDIQNLPYLEAVIKETFRLRPAGPLLVPRQSSSDVKIAGFTVPAKAQVLVNAWAVGRDPNFWEEPDCFIPERFLESNIDYRSDEFSFIPFGGGRRICPGIPLATRMLPLMLGSLIHSFDWKLENGKTFESLDMEESFSLGLPRTHPLRIIPIPLPA